VIRGGRRRRTAIFVGVLTLGVATTPLAAAQPAGGEWLRVSGRLEVAAGGGVAGTSPDVGVQTSFPLGDLLSIDVSTSYLTRIWRSPAFLLTQGELRVPFRTHLRSRRSLVVGVTDIRALHRRSGDSPLWRTDARYPYPHVGTSLQWPIGSHADFRLDTQLIVQFGTLIPVVPRAVGRVVWHPVTGGTR
jgi:hypothetical protein